MNVIREIGKDLFGGVRGVVRGSVGGLITYILADASLASAASGAPSIVAMLSSLGVSPGAIAIVGALAAALRNRKVTVTEA